MTAILQSYTNFRTFGIYDALPPSENYEHLHADLDARHVYTATRLRRSSLRELVIPGSHDAGTFAMQIVTDNLSSQCQDISILEQLKAGSRYLDLRAWKAMDGLYWMYHGAVWTKVKLEDVLKDIKTFLDSFPSEVVIATLLIDDKTNEDAGWDWACTEMKDYMATSCDVNDKSFADVTLKELRSAGKRLVCCGAAPRPSLPAWTGRACGEIRSTPRIT